ncbi:unnamed protein product [Rotaria magnacalcarata]|uniref:Translin-associated factor X-interacting protein 1 N-terminal domain-containing protein n=1 Tax=Rotaria magnacalcarata TaxID=392030 RepID=A0A8S2PPA9_9BILA|nr:unnamed protein product [Rotaria magnacalcarata]
MEVTPYVPTEYSLAKTEYDPHRLPPIRSGDLVSKSDETPVYTVNNNRYALPPSNILRTISDQQSGEIDSWPANASGGSSAFRNLALTNQGRLVQTGASLRGKLDTTPKPRFLAIIEDYLYRELKALGVEDAVANESRLQVFREVFSTIIDDFKTYKPLLAAIKNEYEIMLTHLNDKVIDLEPLRQQLVLLSEQCDKKLMQYRKEEREEISLLKEEKRRLQQTIRQLTNQNQNLETNIQRSFYSRTESIQNFTAVFNIIIQLQARKDLNGALAKITHMEANYNDVVPRRDFVALEAKSGECLQRIKELQIVNDNQSQEIEQLRTQNENFKEDVQRLQREKDELNMKNENIHDEMTPRPSWDLAGEVIDGGAERWMNVSVNKTSQEKLVLLLNEFTGGNDDDGSGNLSQTTTIPEQLSPRGEGEQVPFHLRSSRSVKNRRLTRRDVAVLIQEIWTERRISDKQDGRTKSLSEFIYEFFRNRYGNHNTAVEMGYNLDYSCKRFKHNENCQLFYHILSGEADEDIYHYTKNLIEQLADRIIKESETHPNGTVTADAFHNMLTKYLPNKTPSDISELVAAAEKEQPNTEQLSVAKLFSVDDEDNYGEFIRVLKRHLNEDKQNYAHDVSEKIENSSSVSAKDLESTLRAINPHIQTNELAHVVQWTFEAKDGSQIPSMSANDILQRLQNGVFFRQHTLAAS